MTKDEMQNRIVAIMRDCFGLQSPSCVHDESGVTLEYRWGGNEAIVCITGGEIIMNSTPETARNIVFAQTSEAAFTIFGDWYDRRMWQTLDADHIGAHYHGA